MERCVRDFRDSPTLAIDTSDTSKPGVIRRVLTLDLIFIRICRVERYRAGRKYVIALKARVGDYAKGNPRRAQLRRAYLVCVRIARTHGVTLSSHIHRGAIAGNAWFPNLTYHAFPCRSTRKRTYRIPHSLVMASAIITARVHCMATCVRCARPVASPLSLAPCARSLARYGLRPSTLEKTIT